MTKQYPIEEYLNTELPRMRSIGMSAESKERIKLELAAYAEMHAVRADMPVRSPLTFTFMPASFWRISSALAALLLIVGGSAYASTDALPGSPLYPVKVSVAEPVETALIPGTKGKAAWHAILAERRLDEATKLAVAGNLDAGTEHFLTANFSAHVADAVAGADELQQHGDVTDSLDVRSDLDARLSAHENILAQVVNHLASDGVDTETDTAAQSLLAVVANKQDSVEDSRLALEDTIDASASAKLADADDTVSSSTEVAINDTAAAKTMVAPAAFAPRAIPAPAGASADVQMANTARTMEVSSIMAKYAPLLASLPAASTTASTTATTTATTTDNVSNSDDDSSNNMNADSNVDSEDE
jgi:hypothetical protein